KCCAWHTIMNQPDILAQIFVIQTLPETEGFLVSHLPKYHCELNLIKQCWGAATYLIHLEIYSRFAACSQWFIHAYFQGLLGNQLAWAANHYCGHRINPLVLLEDMGAMNWPLPPHTM
ncbi:hypothetical protein B0J17DRAFT_566560, partial [Rhizoctonia solani]